MAKEVSRLRVTKGLTTFNPPLKVVKDRPNPIEVRSMTELHKEIERRLRLKNEGYANAKSYKAKDFPKDGQIGKMFNITRLKARGGA